jgi:hypothetical protein
MKVVYVNFDVVESKMETWKFFLGDGQTIERFEKLMEENPSEVFLEYPHEHYDTDFNDVDSITYSEILEVIDEA